MAASRAAVYLSGGIRSCWGTFRGTVCRRTPLPRPSIVENARSVHSTSPTAAAPKNEEPVYKNSMFIGGAKAENPMKKVGFAWVIGFPSGILLFLYAKNKVDKRRLEQMKARQRMRDANKGEYASTRFTKSE